MGIFSNIFGGSGQPTATTTHLQNLANHHNALQAISNGGVWTTNTSNPHMQQINNPSTWGPNTYWAQDLKDEVEKLKYILKRTVENYEELQEQYKALQDITKAGENK